MAQAFSLADKDTYIDAEEVEAGKVTLTSEAPGETLTITVEAVDLARALITGSPSFALAIGDIAREAIIGFLGDQSDDLGEAVEPTAGD